MSAEICGVVRSPDCVVRVESGSTSPISSLSGLAPRILINTTSSPDPNRWKALAVLGVAYLIVVLDSAIVNVALPTIQTELSFAPENLQWIVTGYANSSDRLSLGEQQRLWITLQMIEVARQIDPDARLGVSIDQPWGDYLAIHECAYNQLRFLDAITRAHDKSSSL